MFTFKKAILKSCLPLRLLFLFSYVAPSFLNAAPSGTGEEAFVGMTIENLIDRFGIPLSVYAVRGLEEWQDDVVFVYSEGDFYVFRDRVWQIAVRTYMGINTGDPGTTVRGILDAYQGFSFLESRRDSISYSLYGGSWPMILRCDFDDRGRIRGIFIFRSDL